MAQARATLRIRDPHKMKDGVIHKALDECSAEHPVFYEDEVDIHLNPKIGGLAVARTAETVVTPGQTKNTIWPAHCTVARVKSATWAATAKVQRCLSLC
ncbi:putative transposase [Escherichia coli]|nr:putative transposase [Escherichia coli]